MIRPLALERLSSSEPSNAAVFVSVAHLKMLQKKAYAQGFSKGCAQARKELEGHERALVLQMSEKVQDIAFTYAEAQKSALKSLSPLLRGMIELVLPEISGPGLRAAVVGKLIELAKQDPGTPICVSCAPEMLDPLRDYLERHPELSALPVLYADPALAPLDVSITAKSTELSISFSEVLTLIEQETTTFLSQLNEEHEHG